MYARRRRNLLIGVGVGLAVILVALLVLASVVSKIFGNLGGGLNKDELGLNGPSSSSVVVGEFGRGGRRGQTHQGDRLLPRR